MKKSTIIYSSIMLVLVIGTICSYFSNKNIVVGINKDYINSEVLWASTESIDEILFAEEKGEYATCICSVDNNTLMLLFLEIDNDFSMSYKYLFSINTLTDDETTILKDDIMGMKAKFSYNVFLNPKSDFVIIDGTKREVKKFKYHTNDAEYDIGFWWCETEA